MWFNRIEHSNGTFVRSFVVPEDAAEDRMKADCMNEMVLVHLPKTERPKAKGLEVKVE